MGDVWEMSSSPLVRNVPFARFICCAVNDIADVEAMVSTPQGDQISHEATK
jgi:hypothetical protein